MAEKLSLSSRFLAALLLLFSFVIFSWAVASEYAALSSLPLQRAISTWSSGESSPEDDEIAEAMAKSKMAAGLIPFNADYALGLAMIHEWKARQSPLWTRQARESRGNAIEYYKQAAKMRPSWGYLWAQLAASKVLNQEMDDEALSALDKAMTLTPWAPYVHRKIIWTGIRMWNYLPLAQREHLIRTIERTLKDYWQVTFLVKVAVQEGWEENLRPLLREEAYLDELNDELAKRASRTSFK